MLRPSLSVPLALLGVAIALAGCEGTLHLALDDKSSDLTVVSLSTSDGQAGDTVAPNTRVAVTLSADVDAAAAGEHAITLQAAGRDVPGTTRVHGAVVLFTPLHALPANTTFVARLEGATRDYTGHTLGKDLVWTFATGWEPDTAAPVVTSALLAQSDQGIAVNGDVVVTFSEDMDPWTFSASSFQVAAGDRLVPGHISVVGHSAVFNPATLLNPSTRYEVTVTGVADLAGNFLEEPFSWSFFASGTGGADTQPPQPVGTAPRAGQTDVGTGTVVVATFTEALEPSSVASAMTVRASDGTVVDGEVTVSSDTVTFRPFTDLDASTTFTARIGTAVMDLGGNHLEAPLEWTFRTADAAQPQQGISLGTSARFAVVAGGGLHSTGSSHILGSVALDPSTQLTGFASATVVPGLGGTTVTGTINGDIHLGDPVAAQAVLDARTAYAEASADSDVAVHGTTDFGGRILTSGTYHVSRLAVSAGRLTLDGQGDPAAVFVLQADGDIDISQDVVLTGGADAGHVFWLAGGQADIGSGADVAGMMVADQGVSLHSGSVLRGLAASPSGSVDLDSATVAPSPPAGEGHSRPLVVVRPAAGPLFVLLLLVASTSLAIMVVLAALAVAGKR